MTTFILIRHGLTDAVGHTMSGHSAGVHLNAAGRDQAAGLPARLGNVPIAAIYSSPLERARETAQPIADARGLRVEVEPRFVEVDFGGWTNRRFADLADDPHWRLYNQFRGVTRPPAGEALVDVQTRTVAALLDIQARHPDDVVAVVSHADTLRAGTAVLSRHADRLRAAARSVAGPDQRPAGGGVRAARSAGERRHASRAAVTCTVSGVGVGSKDPSYITLLTSDF